MTDEELPELEVGRYALRTFKRAGELLGPVSIYSWFDYFALPDAGIGKCWQDGTCTAMCIKAWGHRFGCPLLTRLPSDHKVPHINCSCGIYGCLTLRHLMTQYPYRAAQMVAVIAAEGRTILGARGLRTQYARVVAWWTNPYGGHGRLNSICRSQFAEAREFTKIGTMLDEFDLRGGHTDSLIRDLVGLGG